CWTSNMSVLLYSFFCVCVRAYCHLLSFPTRRSSDLAASLDWADPPDNLVFLPAEKDSINGLKMIRYLAMIAAIRNLSPQAERQEDRKSTRLNSSHSQISYAVFCLKKKR